MLEHWRSGEEDVRQTLQHPQCLATPQAGETMVAYDFTGDAGDRHPEKIKQGASNG